MRRVIIFIILFLFFGGTYGVFPIHAEKPISVSINMPRKLASLPNNVISSPEFFIDIKSGEPVNIRLSYGVKPYTEDIRISFGSNSYNNVKNLRINFTIIIDKPPSGIYTLTVYVIAESGSFFSFSTSISSDILIVGEKSYRLEVYVKRLDGTTIEHANVKLYYLSNGEKFFWMSATGGFVSFFVVRGKYQLIASIGSEILYNDTIEISDDKSIEIIASDIVIDKLEIITPKSDYDPLLIVADISNKNPYIVKQEAKLMVEVYDAKGALIKSENITDLIISGITTLRIKGFLFTDDGWNNGNYKILVKLLSPKGVIYSISRDVQIEIKSGIISPLTTIILSLITTVIINIAIIILKNIPRGFKLLRGYLVAPSGTLFIIDFQNRKVITEINQNEVLVGNGIWAIHSFFKPDMLRLAKNIFAFIYPIGVSKGLLLIYVVQTMTPESIDKKLSNIHEVFERSLKDAIEKAGAKPDELDLFVGKFAKIIEKILEEKTELLG